MSYQPNKLLIDDQDIRVQYGLTGMAQRRHRGTSPEWVQIGRRVYYERTVFEAWIAANRRSSTWVVDQAA